MLLKGKEKNYLPLCTLSFSISVTTRSKNSILSDKNFCSRFVTGIFVIGEGEFHEGFLFGLVTLNAEMRIVWKTLVLFECEYELKAKRKIKEAC